MQFWSKNMHFLSKKALSSEGGFQNIVRSTRLYPMFAQICRDRRPRRSKREETLISFRLQTIAILKTITVYSRTVEDAGPYKLVFTSRLSPMFAWHLLASPYGRGGTACRDGEGDGTTPQRVILSGVELLGATRLRGANKSARRVRRRGIS